MQARKKTELPVLEPPPPPAAPPSSFLPTLPRSQKKNQNTLPAASKLKKNPPPGRSHSPPRLRSPPQKFRRRDPLGLRLADRTRLVPPRTRRLQPLRLPARSSCSWRGEASGGSGRRQLDEKPQEPPTRAEECLSCVRRKAAHLAGSGTHADARFSEGPKNHPRGQKRSRTSRNLATGLRRPQHARRLSLVQDQDPQEAEPRGQERSRNSPPGVERPGHARRGAPPQSPPPV